MRVSGLGDPSGRGEAISFLPRYDHTSTDEEDEAFIDPLDGKKKVGVFFIYRFIRGLTCGCFADATEIGPSQAAVRAH